MDRTAHYTVVRYIPDPARGEALNVGAVLWDEKTFRLAVDPQAVARVLRETPALAADALTNLHARVAHELGLEGKEFCPRKVHERLREQAGFPLLFSDPLTTALDEDPTDPLGKTLHAIVTRIVRPRRRMGGSGKDPVKLLEQQVRPLLKRKAVIKEHIFTRSRTGVERKVNFFANSTVNTAVDVLKLDLSRDASLAERTDAEAFKVEDVLAKNRIKYVVCCVGSMNAVSRKAIDRAQRVIGAVGGMVVTDLAAAAAELAPTGGLP